MYPHTQTHAPTRKSLKCAPDFFLFQLGVILALDVVANNGDRVPMVHRGDGNCGNILLNRFALGRAADSVGSRKKLPRVFAIDNTTTGITNLAGQARYMQTNSRRMRA
jgi:hypothetical protein